MNTFVCKRGIKIGATETKSRYFFCKSLHWKNLDILNVI